MTTRKPTITALKYDLVAALDRLATQEARYNDCLATNRRQCDMLRDQELRERLAKLEDTMSFDQDEDARLKEILELKETCYGPRWVECPRCERKGYTVSKEGRVTRIIRCEPCRGAGVVHISQAVDMLW